MYNTTNMCNSYSFSSGWLKVHVFLGRIHEVREHIIIIVLYFRWTTRWETMCTRRRRSHWWAGGGLEVPGGGVQPYHRGLAHHSGETGRGVLCCHLVAQKYFSITAGEVLVLPHLVKYVFCHNYLVDKNYFRCSWSNTSAIVAGQLLLPLHLAKYFSITVGNLLLSSQLVN